MRRQATSVYILSKVAGNDMMSTIDIHLEPEKILLV